jgi:adenylylsulfate kinase
VILRSVVIWFTGLSGSGKFTLAHAVEESLYQLGCRTIVLDGDNIRHGLNYDLDFSNSDRKENVRRIGEVSKLFVEGSLITLTAFISPFIDDRKK